MKKGIFYSIFFVFFTTFAFSSYSNEVNTLDIVEKVEKNLIYSKEVLKQDKSNDIVIKKGWWTQEDTKDIEKTNFQKEKINSKIKNKRRQNSYNT